MYRHAVVRNNTAHNIAPLYNGYEIRVAGHLCELFGDDPRLTKSVKIEVRDSKSWRLVFTVYRKCWATDCIKATCTPRKSPSKGCFSAAQVTNELQHLAATQFSPDGCAELLGLF